MIPVLPKRKTPVRRMKLLCASLMLISAGSAYAFSFPSFSWPNISTWSFFKSKEQPKSEVADLRYGVALYNYYQQDYLQALTELMVADARDGIHGHGDNPELIVGGVSLAFGMKDHAQKIFEDLLQNKSRPQDVRDAAWFYLGKLQYERADWAAADDSFNRVSTNFNPELLAEMHSLQINIKIKNNQLGPIKVEDIGKKNLAQWEAYTLYNLGAAHARNGEMKEAEAYFTQLASTEFNKEDPALNEYLTLLDKTHTAIGFTYLQEKKYDEAIQEFQKVRMDSIESNQALLGYGWAAMAQEKYADAVKPWQVLQKRSLLNSGAQESLLALPFAYEKLGASGDALREYETANDLLDKELALVRDMRATLTQGELLNLVGGKSLSPEELAELEKKNDPATMTAVIANDGQNWLKLGGVSIVKTRSLYLRELFSKNEFQVTVLDLRDLLKLQKLLQDWQPKLDGYTELLEQKQAWRQEKEAQLVQAKVTDQETQLILQRNELAERITRIKANSDYLAMADEATRKSYRAVERSEQTIARMKAAGQDASEEEEKLRMYRGILVWRASQVFDGNLKNAEATLAKVDEALTQMQDKHKRIDAIVGDAVDLQPMFTRIAAEHKQVDEQLALVSQSIDERASRLQAQVDQQLETHEKRLNRYLAQSRLSVARLYDTALRKQAQ